MGGMLLKMQQFGSETHRLTPDIQITKWSQLQAIFHVMPASEEYGKMRCEGGA
jgi:hypothetical protein